MDPASALRTTFDPARARDWALVLESAGIPYKLDETAEGFRLEAVFAEHADAAAAALAAYDREAREGAVEHAAAAPLIEHGPTRVGLVVAALLVAFFLFTGPREAPRLPGWFAAGAAVAERVLGAEPWRAVTALTLHADLSHVAGNAVATVIFVGAVARWLGPGLGVLLVLLAGVLGNVAAALGWGGGHAAVGASTATFGALGILGALQLVRRRRRAAGRRAAWVPVAAVLALFAVLGVSERADVLAHLGGMGAGLGLGLALGLAAAPLRRPPGTAVQLLLGGAAALVVVAAWVAALS